ncbi:MAG TPA: tRNA (adenosine(37)-N6)-dimethylallyltransferase MiaA [Actinomycetota bacterium]|nr:tRNA (adenosine(37)-N6)-dimethylallyltransferase MiaA [Actinomycetota bacterium]
MTRPRVLALVGPTAAGKTALALEIAPGLGAEIVSMDSAMVYRGMDIGTDKPSAAERSRVPHHLIDIVEPSHTLTVADFQARARAAVSAVVAAGRVPLLVGGSGLYVRAVIDPFDFPGTDPAVRASLEAEAAEVGAQALHRRLAGLDPQAAALIDPANARRTIRALEVLEVTGRPFSAFRTAWRQPESVFDVTLVGLTAPRPELDRRIEVRVEAQIERGLVAEVEGLVAAGMRASATSVQALGYAQVLAFLDGDCTLEESVMAIKVRTRRFARRQERWFGADPRVAWFNADAAGAAAALRAGREAAA